MGCMIALLLGLILLVLLGPALAVMGGVMAIWDWIKPPFVWLWENRVLLSFLIMGGMLVPWLFIFIDGSQGRSERRKLRQPMSEKTEDPRERGLWRLAEEKANSEIAQWERRTGKRKTPAGRREMTRQIFEEMKAKEIEEG